MIKGLVVLILLFMIYSALPPVAKKNIRVLVKGGFVGGLVFFPFLIISFTSFYYTANKKDVFEVFGRSGVEMYESLYIEGEDHRKIILHLLSGELGLEANR